MYSGTSSVPMTSSGSKSRLKRTKGKHEAQDHAGERGADQERTHFRIVCFFDELLSWGCLPLSMTSGFSSLRTGEEMRNDG
jgi:hypothetical protein